VKSQYLQYNVTPPFYFYRECVTLASNYIASEAVSALDQNRQEAVLKLVLDHRREPGLRGGLGQVFEPIVHLRMKQLGLGPIVVFDLDDKKKTFAVDLPSKPMPVAVVREEEDLGNLQPGEYGEPDKGNFPCIDSAVKLADGTVLLIQATVGDQHPIKGERLKDLLKLLPPQKQYPLIFVTVESNNVLSGNQTFLGADGKKVLTKLSGRLSKIRQYVYYLPLLTPKSASLEKSLPLLGDLVDNAQNVSADDADDTDQEMKSEDFDWKSLCVGDKIWDLRVVDLKIYLREHHLTLSGKKADLVQRIRNHVSGAP